MTRKQAGKTLLGPKPIPQNGFMTTTLKKERERLRELYWENLPGMGQSGVLMVRYEPKHSIYCLNLTKKSLPITVEYSVVAPS